MTETNEHATRCPATHQTATFNDGEVIHCSLNDEHAGDHIDRSREAIGEVITWQRTTLDEGALFYVIHGGPNYSDADVWLNGVPIAASGSLDCNADAFSTMADALNAWTRRRNDWTGRFPCWGDGMTLLNADAEHEHADYIIVECAAGMSHDAWTLEHALSELDRSDELGDYVDVPDDIADEVHTACGERLPNCDCTAVTLIADDFGGADASRLYDRLTELGARWGATLTATRDTRRGAADGATVPRLVLTVSGVRGTTVHGAACAAGFVCYLSD